jgi:hypothetical protein
MFCCQTTFSKQPASGDHGVRALRSLLAAYAQALHDEALLAHKDVGGGARRVRVAGPRCGVVQW